jgi:hypothetical protein
MPIRLVLDATSCAAAEPLNELNGMRHLALLLARGEAAENPEPTFTAEVLTLFACDRTATAAAALCAAADGLDPANHYWLRADPVYLAPTRTRLTLTSLDDTEIDQHEANALCAALNEHFPEFEASLCAPHPCRWYLKLRNAQHLDALAPIHCQGELNENHLPRGGDSARWKRILTEAQMLLNAHPVNAIRESAGKRLITGIWIWGGGCAPALTRQDGAALWTNSLQAQGLGRLCGIASSTLKIDEPLSLPALRAVQPIFAIAELHGCSADALTALDRHWFEPLLRGLRDNELDELHFTIYLPERVLSRRVNRNLIKRWWRRPKSRLPDA